MSHFVINLKWMVRGQVKPIVSIITDYNDNNNNNNNKNNDNNNNDGDSNNNTEKPVLSGHPRGML